MGIINIFISTNSRPGGSGNSGRFIDKDSSKERMRVTPLSHLFLSFLRKIRFKKPANPREELRSHSKGANVRCLDCGWKYNFHSAAQCPVCASDRTYLLSNGSFAAGVATFSLIMAVFCGMVILAYRTITG
jgi:hypothetical protein